MKAKNGYLLLVLALLGLAACGGGDKSGENKNNDKLAMQDTSQGSNVEEVFSSFPSPLQTASLLKQAGARYDRDLMNPLENATAYETSTAQAMNLGVYSADLAYANVFERREDAMKYLSAVRKMAKGVGVERVFDKELENKAKRFENQPDSLKRVFSQAFTELKTTLEDRGNPALIHQMFAGAFVEALFLATHIYDRYPSEDLARQIAEQKPNVQRIAQYLQPLQGDHPELVQGMNAIKTQYDSVQVKYQGPEQTSQAEQQGGVYQVGGSNKIKITDKHIKQIRQEVTRLRQSLTQNSTKNPSS
jgi:hypothetical protein